MSKGHRTISYRYIHANSTRKGRLTLFIRLSATGMLGINNRRNTLHVCNIVVRIRKRHNPQDHPKAIHQTIRT